MQQATHRACFDPSDGSPATQTRNCAPHVRSCNSDAFSFQIAGTWFEPYPHAPIQKPPCHACVAAFDHWFGMCCLPVRTHISLISPLAYPLTRRTQERTMTP